MTRIPKIFSPLHLLGWLLAFVLFSWIFWSEGHAQWFFLAGGVVLGSVLVFYSHLYLLSRYLGQQQLAAYALGLLGLLLLGPLPFLVLESTDTKDLPSFLDHYFTTLFSIVLFVVVASGLTHALLQRFANQLRRVQQEKQAAQAELTYLKAQLNPHFLFNTLHNIHALAYTQSPLTPDAILRLASLMRYMLHESTASLVPLSQELQYLQDFITLQQLRYRQSPVTHVEVVGETSTCYLPPLLFIPLLENAYKHSPLDLAVHDIHLHLAVTPEGLTFRLRNPVSPEPAAEPGGIGLANLRKRLLLLYPDQHRLEVTTNAGFFEVVLRLQPLSGPAHESNAYLLYHR